MPRAAQPVRRRVPAAAGARPGAGRADAGGAHDHDGRPPRLADGARGRAGVARARIGAGDGADRRRSTPTCAEYSLTAPARRAAGTRRAARQQPPYGDRRPGADQRCRARPRVRRRRRHLAARRSRSPTTRSRSQARTLEDGALVGLAAGALPRRPRPGPGQRRGPARAAGHRAAAGRRRRRGAGPASRPTASAPADMKLAVIDPGEATTTAREKPAIDTDTLDDDAAGDLGHQRGRARAAARRSPRRSRRSSPARQWGADESMRDAPSLHYDEVHAGLRAPHGQRQRLHAGPGAVDHPRHLRLPHAVPGLERHRLQLPRRPVRPDLGGPVRRRRPAGRRCAHPRLQRQRVRDVGHRQLRDRAAVAGDDPRLRRRCSPGSCRCTASTPTTAGSTSRPHYFKAINGHRDAGSTACPGINLYNRIPRIRELATAAQQGWGGRELESSLVSNARPDLVLRRAVDGKVFVRQIVPTDTGYRLGKRVSTGLLLPGADRIIKAGDWDLDGYGDLIVKNGGGLWLYRGVGRGKFATPTRIATGFGRRHQAGGGGRLHRRRPAGPDGSAGPRLDADLPRRRCCRPAAELHGVLAGPGPQPGARSDAGTPTALPTA